MSDLGHNPAKPFYRVYKVPVNTPLCADPHRLAFSVIPGHGPAYLLVCLYAYLSQAYIKCYVRSRNRETRPI